MKTARLLLAWLAVPAIGACDRNVLVGARDGLGGSTGGDGMMNNGGSADPGGVGGAGGVGADGCMPLAALPRRLWRLTSDQYANSVRDLLSLDSAPAMAPSSDDGSSSTLFINGPNLTIGASFLTSTLYPVGRDVVGQIGARTGDACSGGGCLVTCNAGETHQSCAARFAGAFGSRAFRRPIEADEVTNLMKIYATVCPGPSASCASSADFSAAIGLMIRALILAPSFLYRTELGPTTLVADAAGNYPNTTLNPYEVATQLGYLLLNSTPDAALTAAAQSGGLATSAGISGQVNRLLALPAAQTNLSHAVSNWFGIGQVTDRTKDPALLAALAPADRDQPGIERELAASAEAFVTDAIWNSPAAPITNLLTSPKAFLTDRLATLYGLPPSGAGAGMLAPFTWPASDQRSGMLTQPAFLWAVSDSLNTSIVIRGKILYDDILCQDPLPPEPDFSTPEALMVISTGNSEATRAQARLGSHLCNECHGQLDRYGGLLAGFDAIGRHRTVDEVGAPIDLTTTFSAPSPLAPMTISGPPALAAALISTRVFTSCATQKMTSYAIGSVIRTSNTCEVKTLATQFERSDGTMTSLLSEVMLADFVRARVGGAK